MDRRKGFLNFCKQMISFSKLLLIVLLAVGLFWYLETYRNVIIKRSRKISVASDREDLIIKVPVGFEISGGLAGINDLIFSISPRDEDLPEDILSRALDKMSFSDSCAVAFDEIDGFTFARHGLLPSVESLLVDLECMRRFYDGTTDCTDACCWWEILSRHGIPISMINVDVRKKERRKCSHELERQDLPSLKRLNQPLVSIIMPFYNIVNAKWLCDAFRSIYQQSFNDFEVLLVDDASYNLDSLYILRRIRERTKGYKFSGGLLFRSVYDELCIVETTAESTFRTITRIQNGGLAETRNTGVMHARGQFVLFLDPDDLLHRLCLEQLVVVAMGVMNPSPLSVPHQPELKFAFVYPAVVHFRDDHEIQRFIDGAIVPHDLKVFHDFTISKLRKENYLVSTALIDKDTYLAVGGNCASIQFFEDYDFWARMVSLGYIGRGVEEAVFFYRRHDTGQSSLLFQKANEEQSDYVDEIRRNNPVLFNDMKRHEILGIMETRTQHVTGNHTCLPCYRALLPTADRNQMENILIPERTGKGRSVLYVIPWLVSGGAELYDVEVLRTLKEINMTVTLVLERYVPNSMQPFLKAAIEYVDSIWRLQQMTNSSEHQDWIIDYLAKSRQAEFLFVRATVSGYRALARWSCLDRMADGFPAIESSTDLSTVKGVDILHVQIQEDLTAWEWRSGKLSHKLYSRIVASENMKQYLINVVKRGFDSSIDLGAQTCGVSLTNSLRKEEQERIHVIYPPLATDWNPPENLRLLNTKVEPRLLFAGRFEMQKDPFLWVMTAYHLHKKKRGFKFDMLGDGAIRNAVEAWARKTYPTGFYSPENPDSFLKFHGRVPHEKIQEFFDYKTILLMTSRFEGLPIILLETLSMGVPVVVIDCSSKTGGGLREVYRLFSSPEAWPFFRVVEPVWSKQPLNESFEGALCHFEYEPTAKKLTRVIESVLETIDDYSGSWIRRYNKAEVIRQKFSRTVFADELRMVLT